MKRLFGFVLSLFAAAAFAAPPATSPAPIVGISGGFGQSSSGSLVINWSWTAPSICGTVAPATPCVYNLYQASVTEANPCPSPGTAYTKIAPNIAAVTYTQQNPPLGQMTCTYVTAAHTAAEVIESSPSSTFPLDLTPPQPPSGFGGTIGTGN